MLHFQTAVDDYTDVDSMGAPVDASWTLLSKASAKLSDLKGGQRTTNATCVVETQRSFKKVPRSCLAVNHTWKRRSDSVAQHGAVNSSVRLGCV